MQFTFFDSRVSVVVRHCRLSSTSLLTPPSPGHTKMELSPTCLYVADNKDPQRLQGRPLLTV
jgi:hypothetical protein